MASKGVETKALVECSENDGWVKLLGEAKQAFVLFSGGKDSCAALAYTQEVVERVKPKPSLVALHVDTTASLPSSEEFVIEFCKRLEVPLKVVKPATDYFTLARKWGVPRPRARWCCFHLKIKPLKDYLKGCSDYVVLDGMRREESRKRSQYPRTYEHPHFGLVIHPVIEWTQEQVDSFLESRALLLNPAYELGFSSWECWCGVFKRKTEFERLKEVNPEFFQRLVELESELKSGFAYAYFGGQPFYLRDL
jgi:3'-phosphoadenosine 5'-phosphosulfate sulfotransferase (PAPS reductase)/FAD synthetase